MSVATLYQSFELQGQNVDVLNSEIGAGLADSLREKLVPAVFGNAWTVSKTALTKKKEEKTVVRSVEEVYVPPHESYVYEQHGAKRKVQARVQVGPSQQWQVTTRYVWYVTGFVLEGTIGDQGTQFLLNVWEEQGVLCWYSLFQFPDNMLTALFRDIYAPELFQCKLSKPRVLALSHDGSAFHRQFKAGAHFLCDAEFGTNLKKLVTPDSPFFLGGSLSIVDERPSMKLASWPSLAIKHENKLQIDDVRMRLETKAWDDGEVPEDDVSAIEGDVVRNPVDDGSPDPIDFQASLSGTIKLDKVNVPVWTPLPPDAGVVCWQSQGSGTVKREALIPLLGNSLPSLNLLRVASFSALADIPTNKVASTCGELHDLTLTLRNAAPDPLLVEKATMTVLVEHPFNDADRIVSAELVGECTDKHTADVKMQVTFNPIAGSATLVTSEEAGPGQWKETFWIKNLAVPRDIPDDATLLQVDVDLSKKTYSVDWNQSGPDQTTEEQ